MTPLITRSIAAVVLVFVSVTCFVRAEAQVTFYYVESDDIIANPDRGLQKYSITSNTYYTASNFSNISEATLTNWRTGSEKVTVIYRYFLLGAFMDEAISENYLENIQLDFDRIRNAGLKCLVRFSYTNRRSSERQQPTKEQILEHIGQLAPILKRNRDVIVAHQAGFIGTWGEWYYTNSIEFGTDGNINSIQWRNRKEVVDAMLDATPLDIPIQVRYSQAKIAMYGSSPLDETTAYGDTPLARIGFYNDAFLNVWGDMGTYRGTGEHGDPVGTADYAYLSNETQYTPMSGETNGTNLPRTSGENAVREMNLTNWSIINRDYYTPVINSWISSGHFEEMLKKLGYRLVLQSSTFKIEDGDVEVSVSLTNEGFARIFRKRDVNLLLRSTNGGTEHSYTFDTDLRRWHGNTKIGLRIDRRQLEDGMYDVYLTLPESHLPDRPEYAIRFANDGVWDDETGRNFLGRIELSGGTVTPSEKEKTGLRGDALHPNYPNPFHGSTVISFDLAAGGFIRLAVYNLQGRLVHELDRGMRASGSHKVVWDAGNVGTGIYLVQLESGHATRTIVASLVRM